jgi:hypothetical protein
VKRVYGGAFSGHNILLVGQELVVLRTGAKAVMAELHKLLDHEVGLHIQRLATKLMSPKTVLKWHPRSNSCQQFADTLLDGEDFEHLFPLFPKAFVENEAARKTPGFEWPRYLISFNDHIDGLAALGFQPKSIISEFCQAKRDRCDIIEFAELALLEAKIEAENPSASKAKRKINLSLRTTNRGKGARLNKDSYFELLLTPFGSPDVAAKEITEGLLDALWDLPRDTMSLLQLHILRPSSKYYTAENTSLKPQEWLENRLRVFRQLDLFASLAGGFGAAVLEVLNSNPQALKDLAIPHARIYGTAHASEKMAFL